MDKNLIRDAREVVRMPGRDRGGWQRRSDQAPVGYSLPSSATVAVRGGNWIQLAMKRLDRLKDSIKNFGVSKALADLGLRAANRVVLFKVFRGIRIEAVDRAFLGCDGKYRGIFLDKATLRKFATDPKNELSAAFLDEAFAKGDECYGFLAGTTLAAYGWYSSKPTALQMPGLQLHFSDRYVYMYKGFTATDHRGQRLHAIGMTRALEAYLARGYRGIVSYVEWNNFGSRKSCYRMGYRDFGNIVIVGLGKHYFLHRDAGCDECGLRVKRTGKPS